MQKICLSFPKYRGEDVLSMALKIQYSINSLVDFCMYFGKQTFYKVQQQSSINMRAIMMFA
jgi:hypothetical protein